MKIGQAVAAVMTTAVLLAAPVFAEDTVKNAVCASNPTAKICLKVHTHMADYNLPYAALGLRVLRPITTGL